MTLDKQYEQELEECQKMIGQYELNVLQKGHIDITEKLYKKSRLILLMAEHDAEEKKEIKQRVADMKKTIEVGNQHLLPAIAVRISNVINRQSIHDGHHRIMALWEMGVMQHPAILLSGLPVGEEK